jgi:DNA-binding Lrp family transcriptional regulator
VEDYLARNPMAPANRLRFFVLTSRTLTEHLTFVASRLGVGVVDLIIGFAIQTGGVEYLDLPDGEGWRYATVDAPPPQEARRPISISALARSLNIPRETVRRRVEALIRAGVVERNVEGLRTRSSINDPSLSPGERQSLLLSQVGSLIRLLTEIGYRNESGQSLSDAWLNLDEARQRVRQFTRILLRLQMRHYETVSRLGGDLNSGLILAQLIDRSGVAERTNEDVDLKLTPRRVLAQAIGLNRETLRRCLILLESRGLVDRSKAGYRPSPALMASDQLDNALQETAAALLQQVRLLATHGFIHEPSREAGIAAVKARSETPPQ